MNRHKVYPHYFLWAALIVYTVFFIIPSLMSLYFSFTDWNVYKTDIRFIGLDNFKQFFSSNERQTLFLWNTLKFAVVTTFFKVLFGLLLALLLNQKMKTTNFLRTVFFLPVTLPPLVIGLVFVSVFDPVTGIFNSMLNGIGLEHWTRPWLVDLHAAMPTVMSVEVWRYSGYCMIIFLAGLQAIPKEYYEAATVDGSGRLTSFFYLTLPLLRPALTVNIILNLIAGFKVFDLIFVLTKGGPGKITGVLNTAVFYEFSSGRYGMATAIGMMIFLLTLVVLFLVNGLLSRKEIEL
jgi:raffinose/stachyose/melibiose transport system permease protein